MIKIDFKGADMLQKKLDKMFQKNFEPSTIIFRVFNIQIIS